MSKFFLFFLFILTGGLIYFGIVEVNVNFSKFSSDGISDVSGVANTIVKEKTTFEKGRAYVVDLKRRAELIVIRNKEKRLILALLYVKKDAARLEELIDNQSTAAGLLPQAELLVDSLNKVRTTAQKAPVEVVASQKRESKQAFAQAQRALGRLQEENEEYSQIQQEFGRLTEALEEQIGGLGLEDLDFESSTATDETSEPEKEEEE